MNGTVQLLLAKGMMMIEFLFYFRLQTKEFHMLTVFMFIHCTALQDSLEIAAK